MNIKRIILLLTIFSYPVFSSNNTGGLAGAFLRIPIGARANGMGGSYSAIVNDPTSGWWNPAGFADCQNIQVLAFRSNMNYDRKLSFIGGSIETNYGYLGVHWLKFEVSNIEGRDEFGNKTGNFDDNESAIGLSYAGRITNRISFGLTVKYLNQNLFLFSSHGYGLDLGFKYHSSIFYYGFVLKNILGELNWNTSSNLVEKLPIAIKTGIGVKIPKYSTIISMDINKVKENRFSYSGGIEVRLFKNIVALRSGINRNKFSAGFGLAFSHYQKKIQLDYAFVPDGISGDPINQFSILISL